MTARHPGHDLERRCPSLRRAAISSAQAGERGRVAVHQPDDAAAAPGGRATTQLGPGGPGHRLAVLAEAGVERPRRRAGQCRGEQVRRGAPGRGRRRRPRPAARRARSGQQALVTGAGADEATDLRRSGVLARSIGCELTGHLLLTGCTVRRCPTARAVAGRGGLDARCADQAGGAVGEQLLGERRARAGRRRRRPGLAGQPSAAPATRRRRRHRRSRRRRPAAHSSSAVLALGAPRRALRAVRRTRPRARPAGPARR